MGVVYKARHCRLERFVAVKMVLAGEHAGPEQRDRFLLEARAVARLHHPNILQIYEIGEHQGNPFIALEFVEGGSLAGKLAGEVLAPTEAARMTATLAEAMHHAHQQGIIHRDLKPANVLLTADGTPRIADFGLAREQRTDGGHTHTGAILGSPSYMAPEQATGDVQKIDPRTDVYALGAILYEMLTGRPPFRAASVLDTLELVRRQEPLAPRQLQPAIPRDLETICLKCLQKERDRRYGSAALLAEELNRFLQGHPILARPISRFERALKWARRRPAVAGLLAATMLFLVTLVVGALVYGRQLEATNRNLEDTNEALTTARVQAENDRDRAQLEVATRDRETGLRFCKQGDVNLGLLYLARSLKHAPPQFSAFRHSVLVNLAAWEHRARAPVTILTHPGWVIYAVFSPDGRTIVTASTDGKVMVWDSESARPRGLPQQHPDALKSLAFSPDGRSILTGSGATAQLWDVASGKPKGPALLHRGTVISVAVSHDGQSIATAGLPRTVHLWDADGGAPKGPPLQHDDAVLSVAFSPDGRTVATASQDRTTRLWDVATGKPRGSPLQHPAPVLSVAFSPDGVSFATGCEDGIARLWETATGKPKGHFLQHEAGVIALAFSPDGQMLLAGCLDSSARQWDLGTGKTVGSLLRHGGMVAQVAWSPDGKRLLIGNWGGTASLWDALPRTSLRFAIQQPKTLSAAFSPDGQTIAVASGDRTVRLADSSSGKPKGPALQAPAFVKWMAFSPDSRTIAITSLDRTTCLWDVATGKPKGPLLQHQKWVERVAFSPDGQTVVTVGLDGVKLWETATGKLKGSAPLQQAAVAFSPDDKTVLTGGGDGAHQWNVDDGKPRGPAMHHGDVIRSVAFSPDGSTILTAGGRRSARLWDASTGQLKLDPLKHQGEVHSSVFSPDGRTVATASQDRTARLWEAATGKPMGPPLQHQGTVWCVAISPDNQVIVTGSDDFTAQLWDVQTGKAVGPPLHHDSPVLSAVFSPDGRTVLTQAHTGARLWQVPRPLPDDPDQVSLRVQTVTGMELHDDDEVRVLHPEALRDRGRAHAER